MNGFLMIFVPIWVACIFFLIRNHVIFKIRRRARNVTSKLAGQSIENGGQDAETWQRHYVRLEHPSYDCMVFLLLHKWTFRAFYPDLAEKEKMT
jgi:hypothetical protein